MNNSENLGKSVKDAAKFLQGIYRDVESMMIKVEDLMGRSKLIPTEPNRVSWDLGNSFDSKKWLLRSFYRAYCPEKDGDQPTKTVAIHILMDPPDTFDQPVCLCVTGIFKTSVKKSDVLNNWKTEGSERMLAKLAGVKGMLIFKEGEMYDVFPSAVSGSAFIVPLCSVSSEDLIKSKIVTPLLSYLGNK